MSVKVLGIPVFNGSREDLAQAIIDAARERRQGYVCAVNVHTLTEAHRRPEFRRVLEGSYIPWVDGVPILWAARILGTPIKERTHGHDMMEAVLARGAELRHYFLGGSPDTLTRLVSQVQARWPACRIVGTSSPPFRKLPPEEEKAMLDQVNAAAPDILWVALGAPKQEFWMARFRGRLSVPVVAGVGAAFEIIAGRFSRAPSWLQRLGLEWAWRMAQDPWRLWRRYFSTNGFFLTLLLGEASKRLFRPAPPARS